MRRALSVKRHLAAAADAAASQKFGAQFQGSPEAKPSRTEAAANKQLHQQQLPTPNSNPRLRLHLQLQLLLRVRLLQA